MPVRLTFPPIGPRLTYPYSVGESASVADGVADGANEEALNEMFRASSYWHDSGARKVELLRLCGHFP